MKIVESRDKGFVLGCGLDSCLLRPRLMQCAFHFFFFPAAKLDFSTVNSASVHYSRTHKYYFLTTFSLKMGPTALFTHLKIILLQCFQFSVFSFSKISYIQTDPRFETCLYYSGLLFGKVSIQVFPMKLVCFIGFPGLSYLVLIIFPLHDFDMILMFVCF